MRQLNTTPVSLLPLDTPAHGLWATVARLAVHLSPSDWTLIGGQMVALHVHLAGMLPVRSTSDIDLVANILMNRGALETCRAAAAHLGLAPLPSADGKRLHRFTDGSLVLDVLVPDHQPPRVAAALRRKLAVETPGGRRAIERTCLCGISTTEGDAVIPTPDLRGALVLKARAFAVDNRDRGRHRLDLAQLCATVPDPIALADELDAKELRALRLVAMGPDTSSDPWVRLVDEARELSFVAWRILTR